MATSKMPLVTGMSAGALIVAVTVAFPSISVELPAVVDWKDVL